MDSLNPAQEISRNAECADKLYAQLFPENLPITNKQDVEEWQNVLQEIITHYNLTAILPALKAASIALESSLGDQERQINILKRFSEQIRNLIDRRKLDIAAIYFDSQGDIVKPPFKVKRSGTGDRVYIDDCLLVYDAEKNGNKQNNQWLPLLVALISSNGYVLLETSIEEVAHTSRGDAMNKCISKLNGILRQNYQKYKTEGKKIHKVSVKKSRGSLTRRLCVEK